MKNEIQKDLFCLGKVYEKAITRSHFDDCPYKYWVIGVIVCDLERSQTITGRKFSEEQPFPDLLEKTCERDRVIVVLETFRKLRKFF